MPLAQDVSRRTGLDPRLVLAQAALESGWGESAPGGNFFGIKSHGRPNGQVLSTSEYVDGQYVPENASFRTYSSPAQSFHDYGSFLLENPRYQAVMSAKGLPAQIAAMGASGYATDPEYSGKLSHIASMFGGDGGTMQGSQQQAGLLGSVPTSQRDRRRDIAAALASGFNTLRMRPDPNLDASLAHQRQQRQSNRTAEWLSQQPGGEPYAQMAAMGRGAEVLAAYQATMQAAKPGPVKGVSVDGRLVNPITGQVIYEPGGGQYDPEALSSLRKEFMGLQPVKDFSEQTAAYGRIMSSIKDPSPAGDLSLVFSYMKVLDPGSTVREGEFATAANAAAWLQKSEEAGAYVPLPVANAIRRMATGEMLSPEQREDFASRATMLYENANDQYGFLRRQYETIATSQQFPIELALPSYSYAGEMHQPSVIPDPGPLPPPPAGVDPATWPQVYEIMTPEEKAMFQ